MTTPREKGDVTYQSPVSVPLGQHEPQFEAYGSNISPPSAQNVTAQFNLKRAVLGPE